MISAQNTLDNTNESLRQITGSYYDKISRLKTDLPLTSPEPARADDWVKVAQENNLSLQAQRLAVDVAREEVKRQRAGHYPTLDLVAGRGRSSTTNTTVTGAGVGSGVGSDTYSTTVGLQLSIPIFAGGATVSRDREAVALKERAAADLENARRTAALNARQGYLGVTAGLAQVRAYNAALTSSQSALESNKLGYEVGVRINIDVLNAQSQLYDTRQKLAKARMDTLIALLRLKAAAGSLGEEDVAAINALLD